jgi:hypothetical protein
MSGKVKEYLGWVKTMLSTPVKRRWEWVETIVAGIRSYRPEKAKASDSHTTRYLSDALMDDGTWEILGFATNISYVRVDAPDKDMLKYIWVHPWGTPALLLKHRRLPVVIMAGPGIRWDDTILREITENGYVDKPLGFTG